MITKLKYIIFEIFPLSRSLVIFLIYLYTNSILLALLYFGLIQYIYYKAVYYFLKIIPLGNCDKIFVSNNKNEDY